MPRILSILFLISTAVTTITLSLFYYKKKFNKIPHRWKQVGKITNIVIYPLKSGAPKQLKEARCALLGLEETVTNKNYYLRDRNFVIFENDNHKILNFKMFPKTVLISLESIGPDELLFRTPSSRNLYLKLSTFILHPKKVKIDWYGTIIETVDCGEDAAEWFSLYLLGLNSGFRLGFFLENYLEKPNPIEYLLKESKEFLSVYKNMRHDDGGMYSNLSSYLLINQASVDDINTKLTCNKITSLNMRPNIIISCNEPYAEDNWSWVKINENIVLRTFKPCTRCLIITIDPEKGIRSKQNELLKTLNLYRKMKDVIGHDLQGNLTVFGLNMGLYRPGVVKIGDPVYVNV